MSIVTTDRRYLAAVSVLALLTATAAWALGLGEAAFWLVCGAVIALAVAVYVFRFAVPRAPRATPKGAPDRPGLARR
jgi:hypothetical protein